MLFLFLFLFLFVLDPSLGKKQIDNDNEDD
jgi:hypothetical protein